METFISARNKVEALWALARGSEISRRVPQRHNLLSPSDLYEHILCHLSIFCNQSDSTYTRLDCHYSDSETNGRLRDRTTRPSRAYSPDGET